MKNAFLQADTFQRNVFLQALPEWEPSDSRRFWKLNAPAYGLNDAPVAFRCALRQSLKAVGPLYKAPSLAQCPYKTTAAVGVFTTHTDDILGCELHGVLDRARKFSGKRFGSSSFRNRNLRK